MSERKAGVWVHVFIVAALAAVIVLLGVAGVNHDRRVADERRFVVAVSMGDVAEIRALLPKFSGDALEAEARAALADNGRDLFALIDQGKVQVGVTSVDIQSVSLLIANLTGHGINVNVPPGAIFTPLNTSTQPIVSTAQVSVRVSSYGNASASVTAACASLPRHIPTRADTFAIQRAPAQTDFARLMPVLAHAQAPYPVQQAAVWVLSDDANYEELGHLYAAGVMRIINEADAARALRIIDAAGIDITRRRIWSDRHYVMSQLPEGDLKSWLASR